jgi:nucleotide sugar dehydrogenase
MNNFIKELEKKIYNKEARIAVVGLGYVGLPLAIAFAKKGFFVWGIDIDKDRISYIKKKESYITDVSNKELRQVLGSGRFLAVDDFSALRDVEVIIICVPTPLKRKYHPNVSYIKQAVESISKNIKKGSLVILESTTYPGTTEEVILPLFREHNLRHNRDFYLCFSPERIDPGNREYTINKIPKIVGGISKEATALAVLVYKNIINRVIPVSSARVAEVVKLLENTFRLINIGLIDELTMMAHRMNIDIWEVIEAARTKPFGFMPFYPGPGVGGHCLDKSEILFIRSKDSLKIMEMADFTKYLQTAKDNDIEVLSFDPLKKRSVFRKVITASARPYSGKMIKILTEDGRNLKVTDLHPMFIYVDKKWQLRYAKDLRKGDCLPLFLNLPHFNNRHNYNIEINLIEEIWQKGHYLIDKIRVKPLGFSWRDYAEQIKHILCQQNGSRLPDAYWDYLSDNILPLKYFYALKKSVNIDSRNIKLVTGRGPSYSEMPAQIRLDRDFCRLIGYYLSEGCYTKDKSARIRFSFNRSEKEYIQDLVDILHNLGIRASIYESKTWHTSCIKVSSNLFGFLICEILGCGKDCYTMAMPERIFSLNIEKKRAVLSGIFRGDACVEHFFGKWRYEKDQKQYFHNVNTASISFFTSSRRLFQQLIILLHDLGIIPTFKKRKYTLSIFGYKQLEFFKDIFEGKKKEIILRYLESNKNRPRNRTFQKQGNFATVRIKDVSFKENDDMVYSLETDKPHSFVTSYGIAVHNCIPKDPLYLYWKARHHGFRSRFIKLASDVISRMPEYVADRVMSLVKREGMTQDKIKVLVIGVTYKKDIKDLRKSPSLDIIDVLQKRGVLVSYHDPLIPYLRLNHFNLKSINLKKAELDRFDCVIIATDHSTVDYSFILNKARLIFDSRNVFKRINSRKVIRL